MRYRNISLQQVPVYSYLLLLFFVFSCQQAPQGNIDEWKQEIRDAEHAFAEMAKNEGIKEAFLAFAADDAVLMRNHNVLKTREEIAGSFEGAPANAQLSWSPDFVDVSSSGDLGYTYGKFIFSVLDSLGNEVSSSNGIFHTVWKRQDDGSWKYVWD